MNNLAKESVPASPVDHAEMLLDRLHGGRAAYIKTRIALAAFGTPDYKRYAENALRSLDLDHATGFLVPPMTDEAAKQVHDMVELIDDRDIRNARSPASMVLLATVLDESSRNIRDTSY